MGGTTLSQVPNLMSGTAPTLPGGGQFPGMGEPGPGGPYQARPDLGPGVGFGVGLPTPGGQMNDIYNGNPVLESPPDNLDMGGPYQARPDLGPGVGFGIGLPTPIQQSEYMGEGDMPQVQAPSNSLFATQQAPITQGTGELPPGFGALSPIDRSQISPNASIGLTGGVKGRDLSGPNPNTTTINSQNRLQQTNGMRPTTSPARNQFAPGMPGMPPGGGGRVQQAPRMNDQMMFAQSANARAANQFGNVRGVTPYSNAPTNRYAPPNAPGVRSAPITRPRIR